MGKEKRFEIVEEEGSALSDNGRRQIFRDKETGVNYLYIRIGYSGGLTPLLDADGKPVIT